MSTVYTKISGMPVYSGDTTNVDVPVVVGGVNYKVKGSDLAGNASAATTTIAALRSLTSPTQKLYFVSDNRKEGPWLYDSTDTTSVDNGGTILTSAGGTKVFKRIFDGDVNALWFGADPTGSADSYAAINAAIAVAKAMKRKVKIPAGAYKITQTINITDNYVSVLGDGSGRNATGSGTELRFYGTGPLFEVGTFDGLAENSALYNGKQGFELRDMHLVASSGTTAVVNEQTVSTYFTGTYAIRDNRGGGVILDNVWAERFEYGFYAYESDFNKFFNVQFLYAKRGMYLGPRSDQGAYYGVNFLYCTIAAEIKGAMGISFYTPTFVECGSTATGFVLISSGAESRQTGPINFFNPWFELDSNAGTGSVRTAVLEIGTNETSTGHTANVTIESPALLTARSGDPGVVATIGFFLKTDTVEEVIINNPSGYGWANLRTAYVWAVGTGSPVVQMKGIHKYLGYVPMSNTGTGRPSVYMRKYSDSTGSIGMTEQSSGVPAASSVAKGFYYTPVLDATANNDALFGVVYQPTFQDHGFTSVTHYSANYKGSILIEGNNQVSGRIDQFGSGIIIERATSPIIRPWLDNSIYMTNTGMTNGMRMYNTGQFEMGDSIQSTSVDASAQLKLSSTTKGFLPPRMTTTQKNAITSPTEGLVVYDTTLHKLCVRTASAWETITST
jgi:hypothetical protein